MSRHPSICLPKIVSAKSDAFLDWLKEEVIGNCPWSLYLGEAVWGEGEGVVRGVSSLLDNC